MSPVGEEIHDPVQRYYVALRAEGENLIIDTRVEPGGGVPVHAHPSSEEHFSVQQGQVAFRLGRRKMVLGPGEKVVVPPGTKHRFRNVGDTEAKFRAELRPGLNAAGLFEETAAMSRGGLVTRRGIPTSFGAVKRGAELLDRYSEVLVVYNPPRFLQRILIALLVRSSNAS
jgi:quercetin dioxygenase-like cupin family protein